MLARLEHPGIARIYAAGRIDPASDGGARLPFLAMELVDGVPIDEFVRRKGLPRDAVLELLASTADAVAHAHRFGILHRDLKPANILVDASGRPRIVDFGTAMALHGDDDATIEATRATDSTKLVGTLAYMSPEQTLLPSRELDTRCDVYALGVVGFELLAGRPPFDISGKSLLEALRILREGEAPRLGSVVSGRQGDLEVVIATALAREPDDRYPDAASFAADLRRVVASLPVRARPHGAMYLLRRLASRNRVAAITALVVFACLAIGTVISTTLYLDASSARRAAAVDSGAAREALEVARRSADESRSVRDYLEASMGGGAASSSAGRALWTLRDDASDLVAARATEISPAMRSVWELLDRAADTLEGSFEEQPELAASLRVTIGEAYRVQGRTDRAIPRLERGLAELEAVGTEANEVAAARLRLARAHADRGDFEEALALATRAEDELRETHGEGSSAVLDASRSRALYLLDLSRYAEADARAQAVLQARRSLTGDHRRDLAKDLEVVASVHLERLEWKEAEAAYREAVELRRETGGAGHPSLAKLRLSHALTLRGLGRLSEAEAVYVDVLAVFRSAYGERHPSVVVALINLARLRAASGDLAAAEDDMRASLALAEDVWPEGSHDIAGILHNLGMLLKDRSKVARAAGRSRRREARQQMTEARELVTRGYEMRRARLGDHSAVADSMMGLAGIEWADGRYDEAERWLERAVELRRELYGSGIVVAEALAELAGLRLEMRKVADAEPALREALRMFEEAGASNGSSAAIASFHLANLLLGTGRLDEAEPAAVLAYERCCRAFGVSHPSTETPRRLLREVLARQGREGEAEERIDRLTGGIE